MLNVQNFKSTAQKYQNRFPAVTPPHTIRFSTSTDLNVPVLGAGMLAVSCTVDFLVLCSSQVSG